MTPRVMTRFIKRYPNRKLYDTEQKCYISLDAVHDLVRQGHEVQVIENSTGEDLTAQTLTRIIVEGDRQGRPALPADILHQLIRWGGVGAGHARPLPARGVREDMDRLRDRIAGLEALLADLARIVDESGRK